MDLRTLFFTSLTVSLLLIASKYSCAQNPSPIVTVAVPDSLDAVYENTSTDTTISYLQQTIKDFDIQRSRFVSADAHTYILNHHPDFVIAPPGIELSFNSEEIGSYRIATRRNTAASDMSHSIGSTIVALKTRTDLETLADLRGKTVAATLPDSVAGWLALKGEVADLGVNPDTFFSRVHFLNSLYPSLLSSLWGGSVDAIVLPACYLERLDSNKLIDINALKIIGEKSTNGFHCKHSTALYPDISIYAFSWTDEQIVRAVTIALLTAPGDKTNFEWLGKAPANTVDTLFKKLEIGPYSFDLQSSIYSFYRRYSGVIQIAGFLLLMLIAHGLILQHLVKKRTSQLSKALTEQQRAEEIARKTRARLGTLERRNIVNQMSGMIAHEVKSPIGAILNFKAILDYVLPESSRKDPNIKAALCGIESESLKIAGIVDRVRQYAKSQKSAHRPVRLIETCNKAINSIKASTTSQVQIHCDYQIDDSVSILGDALELELLIVNLLKNAWQAQVSRPGPAHVFLTLTLDQDNSFIDLRISNPGKILSDQEFERLNMIADSVKPEGLGMGLSIVRGICDSLAASIHIQRNPNGGITVTVRFHTLKETS